MGWEQLGAGIDGEVAGENSGYAVSLSADGMRLAVYALSSSRAWHVRVWEWRGTAWVQMGADIDGEGSGYSSGYAISLSADGSKLAVGAPWNTLHGTNAGHVRVWAWSGTAWVQMGADIHGETSNDQSGCSVSLSSDGTRLAVGATHNNAGGYYMSGHVRVYNYSGVISSGSSVNVSSNSTGYSLYPATSTQSWHHGTTQDPLEAWNGHTVLWARPNTYDYTYKLSFTSAVTLWGVMARKYDGGATVKLYDASWHLLSQTGCYRSSGHQINQCTVRTSQPVVGDLFYVVIDSHRSDWNWMGDFVLLEGAWTQLGADIDGEAYYDQYGRSVSLSSDGTRLAVGAVENDGGGYNAGHVRVFEFSGKSDSSMTVTNSSSGYSVHSTTTAQGGHYGTTQDPLEAWNGHVVMWARPNTYDYTYTLRFSSNVTLWGVVARKYDHGATVKLLDASSNLVAKTDCYQSSGYQINRCTVSTKRPVVGQVTGSAPILTPRHSRFSGHGLGLHSPAVQGLRESPRVGLLRAGECMIVHPLVCVAGGGRPLLCGHRQLPRWLELDGRLRAPRGSVGPDGSRHRRRGVLRQERPLHLAQLRRQAAGRGRSRQ